MSTEIIFPLILAAVLLFVLLGTIRLLRSGQNVLVVAFFAFAVACVLFSTLYWITWDLIRGDARMPFAANEICEWACFLLLASTLRAAFGQGPSLQKAILPATLFAAANTALWIAWSGEWVQDILTGLSLGWLLCVLIACIIESEALSRAERIGLGCAAVLVIAAQAMTFIISVSPRAFEMIASFILFAVDTWLILKTILSVKKSEQPQRCLCLSFAAFAWSEIAMYMSGGAVYLVMFTLSFFCYLLMLWAIRKEVTAA